MIAYEELEKALARWKARRPEALAGGASAGAALSGPNELGEATPMAREELGEATPMRRDEDLEATSMGEADSGIPTGVSAEDGHASDSTGELEIGDAVPEER
jgi:hypothetical protein